MKKVTTKQLQSVTFDFGTHVVVWTKKQVEIHGKSCIGYEVLVNGNIVAATQMNPNMSNSLDYFINK